MLAKYIAEYFSIYFRDDWLIKDKKSMSQVGLSRNERKNNVKNIFSINSSILLNKKDISNVLLIDDIFTTGATVEACCRELKRVGIKEIFVLTLARAD